MVSLKLKIIGLCLILICFFPVCVFAGSDGKKGFMMEGTNPVTIEINQTFTTSVEIFPFDKKVSKIYGLAVSGNVTLNNDNSVARVILLDQKFNEYLVYEAYSLLEDNLSFSVVNSSEETSLLNWVSPYLVRIEVTDASISLDSLTYASGVPAGTDFQKVKKEKKAAQSQEKINKINQSLKKKGKRWFAGKTSVSELTYAERKKLYGQSDIPPGMEYYSGGVIELGNNLPSAAAASPYVGDWDWRNRHGENWITSIKNQGSCGSCWAFAATGSTEALVNLFYNQHLDLNLSEQDVLSCSGAGSCSGGWPYKALDYITDDGIVDEETFPYTASNQSCYDKGSNPSQLIKIGGRIDLGTSSFPRTEDGLKKTLIEKGPICGGINDWSHSMVLVGYKVVEAGDHFFYGNGSKLYDAYWVTIPEGDPLIGKTVWFFKNSWGNWGDDGYGYFEVDISNFNWTHALLTPVSSEIATYEVACVDKDGDGYYWWGIGPKPASCPDCPDLADGDDSNPNFGPLDEYGHLTGISGNNPPVFNTDPIVLTDATEDAAYINSLENDATDPDLGDTLTFSRISGPPWLVVATDGTLSGTPGLENIGLNEWTVRVEDPYEAYDEAAIQITVRAAGQDTDYRANGESTIKGTVSEGDYVNTKASDHSYEAITEEIKAGKWSQLDHTWTFDIAGNTSVVFMVEAYHSANSEGDDFVFAYSTDNVVFNEMFTVTKTSDNDASQSYELPPATSGTVYVRVTDTDNTRGNTGLDTLYVDDMLIRTSGTALKPGATFNPAPADGAVNVAVDTFLTWSAGAGAEWHDLYFGTVEGNLTLVSSGQTTTSYNPGGLTESTTYYWRVDEGNSAGTTEGPVWSFTTTGSACTPSTISVASIATELLRGSKGQSFGQATVTVLDNCGDPVSGADVTGHFTGDFSDERTVASDQNGQAVFTTTNEIKKPVFSFEVTNVVSEGLTWP